MRPLNQFVATRGAEHRPGRAPVCRRQQRSAGTAACNFVFEETSRGSRITTTTYFASLEELEQLVEMGIEKGLRAAMGQMDPVLADLSAFASGSGTVSQILSDTQARPLNELTITPVTEGTLLAIVITFPDAATRDAILATGVTEGMKSATPGLSAKPWPKRWSTSL